ncbi:hypothetical protein HA466_0294790 [Hirschfeldia incana]|nr:hypothetical protein HA466_0294790 [Hirschfeldia incana]
MEIGLDAMDCEIFGSDVNMQEDAHCCDVHISNHLIRHAKVWDQGVKNLNASSALIRKVDYESMKTVTSLKPAKSRLDCGKKELRMIGLGRHIIGREAKVRRIEVWRIIMKSRRRKILLQRVKDSWSS